MRETLMTLVYSCKSGLYYETPVLPVVLRASIAWEVSITSINSKPNLLMLAYAASYSHSYFLDQIVHLETFCADICSKSVFRSMVPILRTEVDAAVPAWFLRAPPYVILSMVVSLLFMC